MIILCHSSFPITILRYLVVISPNRCLNVLNSTLGQYSPYCTVPFIRKFCLIRASNTFKIFVPYFVIWVYCIHYYCTQIIIREVRTVHVKRTPSTTTECTVRRWIRYSTGTVFSCSFAHCIDDGPETVFSLSHPPTRIVNTTEIILHQYSSFRRMINLK